MTNYTQCKLQKGDVVQVSWIPAQFASVDRVLRLRDADGSWDDGWLVAEKWETVSEEMIPDSHDLRKAHKRATGDVG